MIENTPLKKNREPARYQQYAHRFTDWDVDFKSYPKSSTLSRAEQRKKTFKKMLKMSVLAAVSTVLGYQIAQQIETENQHPFYKQNATLVKMTHNEKGNPVACFDLDGNPQTIEKTVPVCDKTRQLTETEFQKTVAAMTNHTHTVSEWRKMGFSISRTNQNMR